MPITLNHSNIGVQYNTGSNYIIETVKSDLYLRNEIVDTIVSNNIQTAPVTPIVSIQEGSNVYAVESYTYSGTANTADFTRVFTKSTTCDILVVGGGGGGGYFGGGGGGGAILFANNITLGTGSYTIKVGKGGTGVSTNSQNGTNGQNSSITINTIEYIAKGGGGGGTRDSNSRGRNGNDGGSGGGSSHSSDSAYPGIGGISNKNTYGGWLSYGNNGGRGRPNNQLTEPAGAGGGGGGAGSIGSDYSNSTGGGNGGLGIDFSQYFTTSVGHNGWFGGGGGGMTHNSAGNPGFGNGANGLFGGGGNGGFDGVFASYNENPAQDGLPNTGGGGGGSKYDGGTAEDYDGGDGGSGIVIIRYLLGTIPTNNLLTSEPTVISPVMTETVRSFVHSGGTENQTTHTITVGQNTICDILMIGGGGAGSALDGGGGGAGACIVAIGQTFTAGIYTINVGKGGTGGLFSGGIVARSPTDGFSSTIFNQLGVEIYRALGGGRGGGNEVSGNSAEYIGKNGGCGGGAGFWQGNSGRSGGTTLALNIVNNVQNIAPSVTSTYGVYGNAGGLMQQWTNGNYSTANAGGGGGIGVAGSPGTASTNRSGVGGNGLNAVTINSVTYNFSNHFANGGVFGVNGYIGGGGGGGGYSGSAAKVSGGLGGGGTGDNAGSNSTFLDAPTNGTPNTGSGGGGAPGNEGANGGYGGSGIVIIKFKSTTAISEGNPITHKRLTYVYNSDNLVAWYKFNGDYLDSSGNGHNLTNVGTVIQSTYIIEGQAVEFDSTDYLEFPATINPYTIWNGKGITFSCWVRITAHETNAVLIEFQPSLSNSQGLLIGLKTTTGGNKALIIIVNNATIFSYSDWNNSLITNLNVWRHLVFCVSSSGIWDVYLDNVRINGTETANIPNITYNFRFINRTVWGSTTMWDGQMDDFRIYDRALSATDVSLLYNKTYSIPPNTYTLNFPVPTIADINNNSNIVLRGAYDISLSTMNSSIIPKSGQYIPKPTSFTSDLLSIRYNLLNPVLDISGAQLTYNTSNTNVYHMGNVGIGTKSPEYSLDVRGSVNAKSYYLNGRQINEPISELGLSEGMIAQVRHLTYTQMDIKNNTGWDAINDNLTTGFVIAITPKSNLSKILVNIIVHIGLAASNSSVWWGIKLYRKIGSGDWTEVTGPNGTETGSAAATAGTPVWISYTMYAGDSDYIYKVTNVTGTYLDSPNTTSTVYYTAYWNNRLGDNPSAINTIYLNRAESHGDAWRPAPSSSWTASEIWYG